MLYMAGENVAGNHFSMSNIQTLFSEEIKYWALGASVFLFLVAIFILIWQIHQYCLYTEIQSVKNGTSQSSHLASYQLFDSTCLSSSSELASSTESLEDVDKKQIQGTLCFSLFYDQLQSQLVVTVLEAKGLAAQAFGQCVHLFVHVRVLCLAVEDKEQQLTCVLQEWQTQPVKDSCNPTFREKFSCTVTEEIPRLTLRLELRDFDKYSQHGILGEVRASLNGLNILYPLEMLVELQKPKKDVVGKVLLSLKYMPTSHRLEVGVLKIKMVPRSSKVKRDIYARTKTVCNQRKIQSQRTSERTRQNVTVFNEVLILTLPEAKIRECILTLSVYEICPQKRSKHLIGQLSFGKSKSLEDEHWRLMMHAVRQPVAKWHLLYI